MSETHTNRGATTRATGVGGTEPQLLDHDCDGIREYDNPMPFWWGALFWASIIFALPYFAYYHFGGVGTTLTEDYESEVGAFYEMQAAKLGNLKPDAATILALSHDSDKLLAGRNMFRANCATCHAPDGGGKTGPNLADDFYINVRQPQDVFQVVREGRTAKGMPNWGKRFSEPQLVLLASYVVSLRGTTPAAPREPQGDRIAAWENLTGLDTAPATTTATTPPSESSPRPFVQPPATAAAVAGAGS